MKSIAFSFALIAALLSAAAQSSKDSIVASQSALRDDFINKIKAQGFTPRLSSPKVIVDNPPSWGNYNDSANTIETCDWSTLPEEQRAVFANFATNSGHGMTAEGFFKLAVYQWIFVHELGHWWRACRHDSSSHYEEEKAANRLAAAYWRQRDPSFYTFMLTVFQGAVDHIPSPVPPGTSKEAFFNDHYENLPGGASYSWYQSIMNVEIGKEKPSVTFAEAVNNGGMPE